MTQNASKTSGHSSGPALGVVTVTYSPGKHLTAFLDSLAAATTREVEVVLADNGSTDGAPERAAELRPEVSLVPTGGNIGYGAAMNAGVKALQASDGEFVLLSNPDVEFHAGAIDELLACAQRHPQAAAIGPRIVEPDGSTYPSARSVPTLGTGIGHALLAPIWPNNPFSARYHADQDMESERAAGWLSGSCLLVRREAFAQVGGFDESYFMYMEDVDLGDRFGRAGWSNIYCPQAKISHAQGHSTKAHKSSMVPAHHASAFKFQADRHVGAAWWPLRAALWAGLKLRSGLSTRLARRAGR
nr:glycosyltransferase family 2 protein [Corynebacterium tapiri]